MAPLEVYLGDRHEETIPAEGGYVIVNNELGLQTVYVHWNGDHHDQPEALVSSYHGTTRAQFPLIVHNQESSLMVPSPLGELGGSIVLSEEELTVKRVEDTE